MSDRSIIATKRVRPSKSERLAKLEAKVGEFSVYPREITEEVAPTPEELAAVIASIDPSAETATTSEIIDHHTQTSSWSGADSDIVLEQTLLADAHFADAPDIEYAVESTESVADGVLEALGGVTTPDTLLSAGGASLSISQDLSDIIASLHPADIEMAVYSISKELSKREEFEEIKTAEKTGKDNIQRTLAKVRSQMVSKRAAAVMLACNVDAAFINRELNTGSKFNVYGLGKFSDLVFGASGGAISNAINIAIVKSLFTAHHKGIVFTGEVAKACCSRQYRIEGSIAAHLTRHTVSPSTAPTQASSTMAALVQIGAVTQMGTPRAPIYQLTDAPIVRKLKEVLAA